MGTRRLSILLRRTTRPVVLAALLLAPGCAPPGSGTPSHLARLSGTTSQYQFNAVTNVSNSAADSVSPVMAIDDVGTLHVVWTEAWQIVYSRSFDKGQTFTSFVQVSTGSIACLWPTIAVQGSVVYVAWSQDPPNTGSTTTKQIMFTVSRDGGSTFSTPVNLSNNPAQNQYPNLSVDGAGEIYLVWDSAWPSRAIVMSRSIDGGASFDAIRPIVPVSAPACGSGGGPTGLCTPLPSVTPGPTSGTLFLVWHDFWNGGAYQVQFAISTDQGNTFSAPKNISQSPVDAHCAAMEQGPDGRLVVTYEQDRDCLECGADATLVQSQDNGATFSASLVVFGGGSGTSDYPTPAAAPDGTIVVGWEDNTSGGNFRAYASTSANGAATFEPPADISSFDPAGTNVGIIPAFGPDGTLYLLWEDHPGGDYSVPADVMLAVGTATPSSGPGPDAGGGVFDAGISPNDAGNGGVDAGVDSVDAGGITSDGGRSPDSSGSAGTRAEPTLKGCGCSTGGAVGALGSFLAVASLLPRRRRRNEQRR